MESAGEAASVSESVFINLNIYTNFLCECLSTSIRTDWIADRGSERRSREVAMWSGISRRIGVESRMRKELNRQRDRRRRTGGGS